MISGDRPRHCARPSAGVPPSGIASRAFAARLSSASSSWLGSARRFHRSAGRSSSIRWRPEQLAQHRAQRDEQLCADRAATDEFLLAGKGQQPGREGRTACGPWPRRVHQTGGRASSAGRRLPSNSRLPRMIISRLLKSCATPLVRAPSASSFWAWRSSLGAVACGDVGDHRKAVQKPSVRGITFGTRGEDDIRDLARALDQAISTERLSQSGTVSISSRTAFSR